jgi:UDP-N-acetylmuramoylalanine--D-glutamate ligase
MKRTTDKDAPLRIAGGQLIDARRAALSAWGPHRLEAVASLNDVLYVNDSRATFLDATLESLGTIERRTVWIVGAWGPEMNSQAVQEQLNAHVRTVVLYGGLEERAIGSLPRHSYRTDDLRTAVFAAREVAEPGDVVLFSPACPSGNGFANYEERGAEFRRAVNDL